ncbi:MAG: hypothetical protein Q8835_03015 [Sweet potato little leaf phytoplasma]|nr:hypothetical protein [Sweet potato little leaf phytoplasma]
MRAYEIKFKEEPDGFGVYASKDVEPLRRARVIMEIFIHSINTHFFDFFSFFIYLRLKFDILYTTIHVF